MPVGHLGDFAERSPFLAVFFSRCPLCPLAAKGQRKRRGENASDPQLCHPSAFLRELLWGGLHSLDCGQQKFLRPILCTPP